MAVIKSLPATKSLSNQLTYLAKEGKTIEELKEGINCTTDNVEREFNIVKHLHNKTEGKQYYHLTQAFSPEDNISPDKANKLGREWIERNIEGHQVYMVTHIDKNHIHNHFVINSVNMDNGLKLQISPSKLLDMKRDSNSLCERENLSKINLEPNKGISKTDSEYRLEKKGVTPWKDELRQCIDFGKNQTKSIDELKEYLKEHFNIEIRETKNSISYKHPEQNKSVRGNKLGGDYTKEGILNEYNAREIKSNERGRTEGTQLYDGGGNSNSANEITREDIERTILFGQGTNEISSIRNDEPIKFIEKDIRENGRREHDPYGAVEEVRGNEKSKRKEIERDNTRIETRNQGNEGLELQEDRECIKNNIKPTRQSQGNSKDVEQFNSRDTKNREVGLEGKSETICNTSGNISRSDTSSIGGLSADDLLNQIANGLKVVEQIVKDQPKEQLPKERIQSKNKSRDWDMER